MNTSFKNFTTKVFLDVVTKNSLKEVSFDGNLFHVIMSVLSDNVIALDIYKDGLYMARFNVSSPSRFKDGNVKVELHTLTRKSRKFGASTTFYKVALVILSKHFSSVKYGEERLKKIETELNNE